MRWIYLSPHFDDAVLSCGGLIWEQAHTGQVAEIWTIFAGDPPKGPLSTFAIENHKLWGAASADEILSMRRREDETAAATVGVELVHFELPDCIYRKPGNGEHYYTRTVFASPDPREGALPGEIAAALETELEQDDRLISPLALGGHVDHILARQAAETLGRPLHYYADIPYLFHAPESLEAAARGMEKRHFEVSEPGLEAWLEGVRAYQSQLASLYRGNGTLFDAIRAYWSAQAGLSLWQPF